MSSSLMKLLDASLLPAALLIVGKVIGLYLVINLGGFEWQINFDNNTIFSVYPVVWEHDLTVISSYSDLILMLIMLSGFGFYTIRAIYFHDTHVDPQMVAKLVKFNVLDLVSSSYKIFLKATIWFIFNWVAVALISWNSIIGKTFFWVALFAIISVISLSVILLKDIESEIEFGKKNLSM